MGLRDLFKSRTEHSDPAVRARAAGALADKAQLLVMAAFDTDDEVARAAIDRLAALAREDGEFDHLQRIASDSGPRQDRARYAAGILRSGRLAALAGVTDAERLAAVAIADPDPEVSEAALARITDEALLARIADKTCHHPGAALARVRSPRLLRDLAVGGSNGTVRAEAIARIADETVLVEIARSPDANEWARKDAVDRIREAGALAQLVLDGSPSAGAALARLEDSAWLARIALEAPKPDHRANAARRTSDVGVLLRIALEHEGDWEYGGPAAEALHRLRDLGAANALATIAQSAASADCRKAAAERIGDPDVLRRLAETQGPESAIARARLEQPMSVVEDALRGKSLEIRLAAIGKLRDLDALDEILETAREPALREAASSRRPAVKAWKEAQAELNRRIEAIKAGSDYRQELRLRVEGDSQVYDAHILANPDAPILQVDRLEAELAALVKSGPPATA